MTSCEKEKTAADLLIGKWEIQFLHIIAYVDNDILGDSTANYDSGNAWIDFKDDNSGHVYVKDYENYDFTWSVNGDVINFKAPSQATIYMSFTVSETNLTYYNEMHKGPWIQNPSKTYKEEWYSWALRL